MMNKFILQAIVVLGVFLSTASMSHARSIEIGLSPYLNQAVAKNQAQQVVQFLVTLNPGDTARLYDAYNLSSLGTFKVPQGTKYISPKAKLGKNRKVVGKLLRFSKSSRAPGGVGEPSIKGAIKLPQFFRFIGNNHPATGNSDLIILGSPLYDTPSEANFSMAQGHVPSDGYISSSREDSPFGTAGSEKLLSNYRVHYGFPDQSWKKNDKHAHYVSRFITLFIEKQGGKLSSFTHDLNTLFERVKEKAPAPKHGYVLEPSKKLEMNLFQYKQVKRDQISIYKRPVSTTPVSLYTASKAEKVQIGLSWSCQCDVDIYARPESSGKPLYFGNKTSSAGVFHKDFLSSPRLSHAFETITFHKPINLETLFLAANFFSGHVSQSVQLELRIAVGDKTFMKHFHINSSRGNAGDGRNETLRSQKPSNPNWIVFDVMDVVGLRQTSTLAGR